MMVHGTMRDPINSSTNSFAREFSFTKHNEHDATQEKLINSDLLRGTIHAFNEKTEEVKLRLTQNNLSDQ